MDKEVADTWERVNKALSDEFSKDLNGTTPNDYLTALLLQVGFETAIYSNDDIDKHQETLFNLIKEGNKIGRNVGGNK